MTGRDIVCSINREYPESIHFGEDFWESVITDLEVAQLTEAEVMDDWYRLLVEAEADAYAVE